MYNFGGVGGNDEPTRFWDQKVKGQGHSETKCGLNKHFGGGIVSPLSGMHWRILMKHHNYSLPGSRDSDDIVKVVSSKVKVTDNSFQKCTFRRFAVADHIHSEP